PKKYVAASSTTCRGRRTTSRTRSGRTQLRSARRRESRRERPRRARPLPRLTMIVASIDWGFIWDHLPELLRGLRRTLEVSGIAIAGAFTIGLVLGAVRAYRVPVLSQL